MILIKSLSLITSILYIVLTKFPSSSSLDDDEDSDDEEEDSAGGDSLAGSGLFSSSDLSFLLPKHRYLLIQIQ